MSNKSESVESVRSAWTRALRNEVVRFGKRLSRVATVGVWLATYGNADGSSCHPGQGTLAVLTGFSEETVSRCLRVLSEARMVSGDRRPNGTTIYQLFIPHQRPDWDAILPILEDSRQKRAYAAQKEREMAERLAAMEGTDTVRGRVPDTVHGGVPDTVRSGGSGPRPRTGSEDPDTVRGRGRTPSVDGFRTPSTAGGTCVTPTSGRDPLRDTDQLGLSPQPQVRARDDRENTQSGPPHPEHAIPCRYDGCQGTPGRPCTRLRGQQRALSHTVRLEDWDARQHRPNDAA